MTDLAFTVPGKPVGKARPRATIRAGHAAVYTPTKTARYESLIARSARDAMKDKGIAMFETPVMVFVQASFHPPVSWSKARKLRMLNRPYEHKPDIDNIVKSILDGLNGVAFPDDKSVCAIAVSKVYGEEDEVKVVVTENTHG